MAKDRRRWFGHERREFWCVQPASTLGHCLHFVFDNLSESPLEVPKMIVHETGLWADYFTNPRNNRLIPCCRIAIRTGLANLYSWGQARGNSGLCPDGWQMEPPGSCAASVRPVHQPKLHDPQRYKRYWSKRFRRSNFQLH